MFIFGNMCIIGMDCLTNISVILMFLGYCPYKSMILNLLQNHLEFFCSFNLPKQ